MKNKFEMHIAEQPLLIKYAPDHAGLEKMQRIRKEKVAERLMLLT